MLTSYEEIIAREAFLLWRKAEGWNYTPMTVRGTFTSRVAQRQWKAFKAGWEQRDRLVYALRSAAATTPECLRPLSPEEAARYVPISGAEIDRALKDGAVEAEAMRRGGVVPPRTTPGGDGGNAREV